MLENYAGYHVGLKVLLRRGDEVLYLNSHDEGEWDFPGGRIDESEREIPLESVLAREVAEELGPDVKYRVNGLAFVTRRYIAHKDFHIFLVFYDADYLGGEIKISDEHTGYGWVRPESEEVTPDRFQTPNEYREFVEYFGL